MKGKILTKKNMVRCERARMGGDWAVCCLLLTRRIRDVVRWHSMIHCIRYNTNDYKCCAERNWEMNCM